MTARTYLPPELDRFRQVQQLAYRCAVEVANELEPGVTEKEAAGQLRERLRRENVREFFHQPFAWFGDRTRFRGFRRPRDFFPTRRRLEPGMAAILDVAPILDGYAADVGYTFACGHNPEVERLLDELQGFRRLILERVQARERLAEIYRSVDDLVADLGVINCHRRYPFGVLAHRIYHQPQLPLAQRPVFGFGLAAGLGLLAQGVVSRIPQRISRWVPQLQQGTPFCNLGPGSDEVPEVGLWAFEPHIARGEVGAKWEEILVIEERRAYWLDDDLPHVRRQATRAAQAVAR